MLLKGCNLHVSIQLPYSWSPATPRSSCLSMTAWRRSRPTRPLTGPSGLNTISLIISPGSSRVIPLTMSMTKSRPSSKLIPRTPFGYPPMRCFNEKKITFSVWQKKNLKTQHRVISQSANIQIQGKLVRVYPSYPVQIYWWCLKSKLWWSHDTHKAVRRQKEVSWLSAKFPKQGSCVICRNDKLSVKKRRQIENNAMSYTGDRNVWCEIHSKMDPGEVGMWLAWWCHTLVLPAPGNWGLS